MAPPVYKVQKKESRFFKEQVRVRPVRKLDSERTVKELLNGLSFDQLKVLAKKHNVELKATVEQGLFEVHSVAPTKYHYVEKLLNVVTTHEIIALPTSPKGIKKSRRQANNPW